MTDYDHEAHVGTGTARRDVLRGQSLDPWTLIGLDGNDTYYLRIAEYLREINLGNDTIYEPYRGVDRIVETRNGGYDTVILVNGYT